MRKVDPIFIQTLVGIFREAEFVELEYVGLMTWDLQYQMTPNGYLKSIYIGEDELKHLLKHHKELLAYRGISEDEEDESVQS